MSERKEKDVILKDTVNQGRGRSQPIKITDAFIEQVEHYAGLGLSIEEIAHMMNIGASSLFRKKRIYERVDTAIRKGRLKAQVKVSNALFTKATEQNDTSAMIFYLKNRAPEKWADRRKIDHTSSDGSIKMPEEITIKAKDITNDN